MLNDPAPSLIQIFDRKVMDLLDSLPDRISDDPEIQARYEELLALGNKPRFAEMLATRSFPGLNGTNKAFNRGRCNNNQFAHCPELGDHFKRIADAQGVSIAGKHYCYGLGRYPGDPRAWVSDTSEVLAIARDRNLNIDGIVNHKGVPVPPTPDIPLAADIWDNAASEVMAAHPDMKPDDARELVFNRLTGADARSVPDEPIEGVSISDLDQLFGVE